IYGSSEQINEISAAVQQMVSVSQQIVSSVHKIDGIGRESSIEATTVSSAAEEQTASVEQIASASMTLAELAQDLQLAVQKFRL
ncbi:MAG TPA: methyl-accepting chemotaxis protein, partial [Desulfobacteria bacterium]|nr:methyl-accepting chemotaxis protein [Desulfobacteria bacterium]